MMQFEDFAMNKDEPRVLIFTGAGVSAESGVPTFRNSPAGLWENFPVEKVCDIDNFEENYDLVHEFYNARRCALQDIEPNRAHLDIAFLQKQFGKNRVAIVTTNVDLLHEGAGATDVMHVHGRIDQMIMKYGSEDEYLMHLGYSEFDQAQWILHDIEAKPAVVFFGEAMRYGHDGVKTDLYSEMQYLFNSMSSKDTIIVVGTSEVVVPVWTYVFNSPAHKIFIDPAGTENPEAYDVVLKEYATTGVPAALEIAHTRMG